jgi:hypothetical protein
MAGGPGRSAPGRPLISVARIDEPRSATAAAAREPRRGRTRLTAAPSTASTSARNRRCALSPMRRRPMRRRSVNSPWGLGIRASSRGAVIPRETDRRILSRVRAPLPGYCSLRHSAPGSRENGRCLRFPLRRLHAGSDEDSESLASLCAFSRIARRNSRRRSVPEAAASVRRTAGKPGTGSGGRRCGRFCRTARRSLPACAGASWRRRSMRPSRPLRRRRGRRREPSSGAQRAGRRNRRGGEGGVRVGADGGSDARPAHGDRHALLKAAARVLLPPGPQSSRLDSYRVGKSCTPAAWLLAAGRAPAEGNVAALHQTRAVNVEDCPTVLM